MVESVSSFVDSLLVSCNIFIFGVAVGAFLSYHYLFKNEGPRVLVTTHHDSSGAWRASNPDELAVERPSDANNKRRRSSLYH